MTPAEMEAAVKAVLAEVRGYVQSDGGDIVFHGMEGAKAKIELTGACVGCGSAFMTLQWGIEAQLRDRIPGFEGVIRVD